MATMPKARSSHQDARSPSAGEVSFRATLFRPATPARATWAFCRLPKQASTKLRSRGQVSARASIQGVAFAAILEPDGEGGHWMKVPGKLQASAKVAPGDAVDVQLMPSDHEPEPAVPADFRKALAASPSARAVWQDITSGARRDWVHWITSAKRAETRAVRVGKACDMLSHGKRRVCCFDRSGMYSKSMSCPAPRDADDAGTRSA